MQVGYAHLHKLKRRVFFPQYGQLGNTFLNIRRS